MSHDEKPPTTHAESAKIHRDSLVQIGWVCSEVTSTAEASAFDVEARLANLGTPLRPRMVPQPRHTRSFDASGRMTVTRLDVEAKAYKSASSAFYCHSCAGSAVNLRPEQVPHEYVLAPGRAVRCSVCGVTLYGPHERIGVERATWTVEPGRSICRDGVEVFTLRKAPDTRPVEADELAKRIADLLTLYGA